MKKLNFLFLPFLLAVVLMSCNKSDQPANRLDGTYSGYFDGTYDGVEISVSEGYLVYVTAKDKNVAKVEGVDFDTFEVLVTNNGINVQLVSESETVTNFLYLGDEKKLQFTYSKNGNTCSFIGTKQ